MHPCVVLCWRILLIMDCMVGVFPIAFLFLLCMRFSLSPTLSYYMCSDELDADWNGGVDRMDERRKADVLPGSFSLLLAAS